MDMSVNSVVAESAAMASKDSGRIICKVKRVSGCKAPLDILKSDEREREREMNNLSYTLLEQQYHCQRSLLIRA